MQIPAAFSRFAGVVLIVVGIFGTAIVGRAAEKQTPASIGPLYRAYIFAAVPKMNPEATFELDDYGGAEVWSAMEVQVFKVWQAVHGVRSEREFVLCYRGKIIPFVNTSGGGMLSSVVLGDAFYYSFGWGSGIHRSQVGRLRVKDGEPEHRESAELAWADLMVSKIADRVVVSVRGFLRPGEAPAPLGWIDVNERQRIKIIDDRGAEISLEAVGQSMRPPGMRE